MMANLNDSMLHIDKEREFLEEPSDMFLEN